MRYLCVEAYEKLIQNGWIVLVCLVELKCLEYYIVTLIYRYAVNPF